MAARTTRPEVSSARLLYMRRGPLEPEEQEVVDDRVGHDDQQDRRDDRAGGGAPDALGAALDLEAAVAPDRADDHAEEAGLDEAAPDLRALELVPGLAEVEVRGHVQHRRGDEEA